MELRRGFPLTVKESARLIANIGYSGLKNYQPYFVELLVAGVDQKGGHVLAADISGAITDEVFASSGSGSPIAYGVLESVYTKDITNEQAKQIATKAVAAAMERDPGSGNGIDVLVIPNLLIVKRGEEGGESLDMAESGATARYHYYYGPEGRLVLVDSALEAVSRGSTTIGIKTPAFALISSHIKPTKPLVEPAEKIFTIDGHIGATGSGYIGDILQLIDEIQLHTKT